MNEFYLRTESIKQTDILNLSVVNAADRNILNALKANEPCLLEGSRGTGKSFLMRVAELELESESESYISVFVPFNMSSLISTEDNLQFYHWMLAKTLKSLLNKLRKRGIVVSSLTASLLSNDVNETEDEVQISLKEIVKLFEESYRGNSKVDISALPDIEDVKEAIQTICEENSLERVVFFFDEAAHVFRPEQQRQFFNLFKDLRSPYISCNAAIYPGVTHFGDTFELTHDCVYKKLERNISDADYLQYFKDIVFKQSDEKLREDIDKQRELFNTLALSSGGNPRMLLRTLQNIAKFNTSNVNSEIKSFYRGQIWAEHTELGEKYKGHRGIIDWGRDFLEKTVIPKVEEYNNTRKEKGIAESTIYFWIHKDSPEAVKEALRLLTYTGIIRKIDSSVRATRAELGSRYEIKYGCMISLESNPHSESSEFYKNLSIKKFIEFGKNHSSYSGSDGLVQTDDEQQYGESLRSLLEKSIDVLVLLTPWQKEKLRSAGINTIEDLHKNTEENLIEKIYNVGPVRARLMKNAATAELLEYISG
ncbi:ORC-CDC6 family AAA ATPase [Thiomicrolovo sp. ZZH C-3]